MKVLGFRLTGLIWGEGFCLGLRLLGLISFGVVFWDDGSDLNFNSGF